MVVQTGTSGKEAALFDRRPARRARQATTRDAIDTSTMHSRSGKHRLAVGAGRKATLSRARSPNNRVAPSQGVHQRAHMRDLIGLWVFGADAGDTCVGGLASFGECIVTRIEILAFLVGCVSIWR